MGFYKYLGKALCFIQLGEEIGFMETGTFYEDNREEFEEGWRIV